MITARDLNNKIKSVCKQNYLNQFSVDDSKKLIIDESMQWKMKCYKSIFSSLLAGSNTLFMDDMSGLHAILAKESGVTDLAISNGDKEQISLIQDVLEYLDIKIPIISQSMVLWGEGEPLVDMDYENFFDFIFCVNSNIYTLYRKFGNSFDNIIKALACYARHGIILQWNEVTWEEPPKDFNMEQLMKSSKKYYNSLIKTVDGLIIMV